MASDDSADKRQRNWQCERAVQTEGRALESYAYNRKDVDAQKAVQAEDDKPESCTNKRQDAGVQKQCKADNTAKQVLSLIQWSWVIITMTVTPL